MAHGRPALDRMAALLAAENDHAVLDNAVVALVLLVILILRHIGNRAVAVCADVPVVVIVIRPLVRPVMVALGGLCKVFVADNSAVLDGDRTRHGFGHHALTAAQPEFVGICAVRLAGQVELAVNGLERTVCRNAAQCAPITALLVIERIRHARLVLDARLDVNFQVVLGRVQSHVELNRRDRRAAKLRRIGRLADADQYRKFLPFALLEVDVLPRNRKTGVYTRNAIYIIPNLGIIICIPCIIVLAIPVGIDVGHAAGLTEIQVELSRICSLLTHLKADNLTLSIADTLHGRFIRASNLNIRINGKPSALHIAFCGLHDILQLHKAAFIDKARFCRYGRVAQILGLNNLITLVAIRCL